MRTSLFTLLGVLGFGIAPLCYCVDGESKEKDPWTAIASGVYSPVFDFWRLESC
jgi:hypothetical protein